MLRFSTICDQPRRLRAFTGLPAHQFMLLSHTFDRMFARHMETETLDGYQREGRAYSTYANCPLPTPEDKLLFLLTYMKQNTTQDIHGQLFGMTQSNVSKWYRILLPILQRTLGTQGFLPARTCDELMHMLRLSVTRSECIDECTHESPAGDDSPEHPADVQRRESIPDRHDPVPLFIMTVPNDQ